MKKHTLIILYPSVIHAGQDPRQNSEQKIVYAENMIITEGVITFYNGKETVISDDMTSVNIVAVYPIHWTIVESIEIINP